MIKYLHGFSSNIWTTFSWSVYILLKNCLQSLFIQCMRDFEQFLGYTTANEDCVYCVCVWGMNYSSFWAVMVYLEVSWGYFRQTSVICSGRVPLENQSMQQLTRRILRSASSSEQQHQPGAFAATMLGLSEFCCSIFRWRWISFCQHNWLSLC